MPKRTDISSIMIIGAGPIVIGQACEFDYSGAQACKALKEEGYRVILLNSNPATIMTDPDMADATYIEPITPETVERIILKEKPDAILPTMGGQTALNTAISLAKSGFLEKNNVELIGAKADVIDRAEDRLKFRETMDAIGIESPRSAIAHSMEEARESLKKIGLPVVIRPSFTLGGSGGGIAYNTDEFENIISAGLDASPTTEVLIEESIVGWKEYEMEVVRDKADNCIIICSIENIDPMGIHTGDSITVAPALTLTDKEYQRMRDASIACLRAIGVDTGGSNVQFGLNPKNGRMVIIEMNPRVSRSSALASKATGFPIAKIAAKLAVGYTLDELKNDITKTTPASFEPTIDYIVVKIPRFTFEKFPGTPALLNTSMKSVGEAMAIGRSFPEALQKGLRSMEIGLTGLNPVTIPGDGDEDSFRAALSQPRPNRILVAAQAIRAGISLENIHEACHFDPWFLQQLQQIILVENQIEKNGLPSDPFELRNIKAMGFSDKQLAELTQKSEKEIAQYRQKLNVNPIYRRIDTCAGEFASSTSYMYSTYEGGFNTPICESHPTDREKIVILGGGPNRIGQGIEFDYCCVHASYALREAGYETIMVNCNPETVSTDYDTSDRLYFEPLTAEDVIALIRREQEKGVLKGCIVQYGGQTPLKLSKALEEANIPLLGTPADAIDLAEDRERFQALLQKLGLRQPSNGIAHNAEDAEIIAEKIGYPVVIRPSYVLGGRAMEIVHDRNSLHRYLNEVLSSAGVDVSSGPLLIDQYLNDAIETDVDCLADGEDVYVAGVMEHIEQAGIHSGDSACSIPPYTLSPALVTELQAQTTTLAKALGIVGLMNVQYAIKNNEIFILEVNPRASRTVPFVAKATGVPIAKIGARIMAGEKLRSFSLKQRSVRGHVAVKEAVFPFARFPNVDIILGPEMRSTGEVMGIDTSFERAFAKSQLGAGVTLPLTGNVFLSVRHSDRPSLLPLGRKLTEMGFKILATRGTAETLKNAGIEAKVVNKVLEGRPHCVDAILSGEVQLIINTVQGAQATADSFDIRHSALTHNIPHYTTMAGAAAAVHAIAALREGKLDVAPLQSYFNH
ncbi:MULTISPECIES: carbamoyl-phosphate synthase large subunit [unclassified Commensalibacter]|uniref:carbamoyl-phosphate synthase large subunit n=1 Tax=unclassified Commensalibacter TaxID=2630218 RepID=UPI0018DD34C4|nr:MULTISPECIES: carbamoyl-phosphate synthase large subunit [unclassified Commensalibacter]MBH9969235.1 carbamoyl-phosphate synthase large subunit [Commensalibacter sp. M0265]MBH9976590.1 carbamoyl-phosphate synthase large subunit [Commensalibacter sp. M0266]MBH9992473.1 carbamoyl-phosphate synthase large subunit [Commensalibacter sp. M0270]MBI0045766.1 carbamoyl-phosphate synthase large subunit [Commensalibacter sp. M0267]MBI0055435.1 carbamoyl-phosphate synthase large subunit [Commensalibact